MRRSRALRELQALGYRHWDPSDEVRQQVRWHALNNVPEWRICQHVNCSIEELRYHFWRELNLGRDEMLAWAASRMFRLAGQEEDAGVAFNATKLMLQSRSKAWRVPSGDAPEEHGEKPVAALTLAETEKEIARLLAEREAAGAAAAPRSDPEGEGEL